MFSRARPFLDCCRQACALLGALACALPASAHAQAAAIFQIDDVPGEIHLSDRADAGAGVVVRRIVVPSGDGRRAAAPAIEAKPLAEIVRTAATAQRLSPELIDAVIAVESAWRPRAVSARGASGLMQLMPATAKAYGVTDIFDPAQNIAAGARLLRTLLDRYDQDLARALAAYNAGARTIDRLDSRRQGWPNAETAAYVPNVLARLAHSLQALPPSADDARL
jgi:soluble lytic murein transglycosylase-like protein